MGDRSSSMGVTGMEIFLLHEKSLPDLLTMLDNLTYREFLEVWIQNFVKGGCIENLPGQS